VQVEYFPIFLEKKNGLENGAWIHNDPQINVRILPLALTSDVGIIRLIVRDVNAASRLLKRKGFMVRELPDAVEVVPDRMGGLDCILEVLSDHGIEVELNLIIPGIYQG